MMLEGRRFLITGASGGIGSAVADALLEAGAHAVLVGRDRPVLERVAARVDPNGNRTRVVACDLLNPNDRTELCSVASSWQGGIDGLINCAGISSFEPLCAESSQNIDRIVATNLIVPMDLSRQLLPHLTRKAEARIVNIGSVFGNIGFACNSVYSASKFGMRGFSEALRRELVGTSVRVIYFAPRATRTTFNSAAVDALNAQLGNTVDDPAEVAEQLVYALRNDRLEYIVGWPEKLFARINAIVPRLVDLALLKQAPVVERCALSQEGSDATVKR